MPSGRVNKRINELPKISDTSGALPSRFIILTLTQGFYGHEDHGLLKRLLPELPGIFAWALAGRRRLAKRDRFEMPKSSGRALSVGVWAWVGYTRGHGPGCLARPSPARTARYR